MMNIEFYQDKTGTLHDSLYLHAEGSDEWQEFDKLSADQKEMIFEQIRKNPKIHSAFLHLSSHISNKHEILRQFIVCNWIQLNNVLDISDDHVAFEKISCRHKGTGTCPFKGEGIVCIKQ